MPGGDQLDVESRMLVLAPRIDGTEYENRTKLWNELRNSISS